PLKTCEGRLEHGSILNGNIRPHRVSSQWQSTPAQRQRVQQRLLNAETLATRILQRHQHELDAMAKALIEDRELVGKRLHKMLERITPDTGILEVSTRETANDKETNQPR
ncbi:hypothetical protein, partial [Martelella radicis]|uniref:hypothetical protein n=1 Tax=Martelella radicis TaxID=1397476 RepID=UPI001AED307D